MQKPSEAKIGPAPRGDCEQITVWVTLPSGYEVRLHVPVRTGDESIKILELLMEKYSGCFEEITVSAMPQSP